MSANELPKTVEEFQRALREAFAEGADWEYRRWREDGHAPGNLAPLEARRRYPIRKKVRRVVEDEYGIKWRLSGEELEYMPRSLDSWCVVGYNAARVRLFADLVANPTEEVEE